MQANVTDSWLMAKAAGSQMIAQGEGGKVVLVSSARGKLCHPYGYSAYFSSNHPANGITSCIFYTFEAADDLHSVFLGGLSIC